MKLLDWLIAEDKTFAEFGAEIDRTAEAVRRYAKGERIPDKETMPRIVTATHAKVTPNDFFDCCLPRSSQEAA